LNLVGNAIKFTDSDRVELRVVAQDAGLVRFEVQDTGIGISPSKQEVIFEAFRQADGSTTRPFGGTGLGLEISKRLIELIGGRIEVPSELGLGSQFQFAILLPTTNPVEAINQPPAATLTLRNLKILLAEDNRVNQVVAIKLLERDGHSVSLVADGALAVEAILSSQFDLILMDVHMPVLDGIAAALRIRGIEAGSSRRTPIVALSAGVLNEERRRCLQAGMDVFLGKPLRLDALRNPLGAAMALRSPASNQN